MFAGLGLLIIIVPIIELWVIVVVGSRIGILNTLALLILVSIAGAILLKREGVATWRKLQATMARGEVPTEEVTDGALILLGGALLLTPGFVTDIVGLLFVFPGTRAAIKVGARKVLGAVALKRFGVAGVAASTGRRVYDARVTDSRRRDATMKPPGSLPSAPPRPSGEDGSPDTG